MLARLFGRQSRPVGKMAASSRERRFTFLVVYSHGKTHRMSFSLTALVSVLALACISLVALGAFVNSYIRTSKENQELNYLYDVAGIQEMVIQYFKMSQGHIREAPPGRTG